MQSSSAPSARHLPIRKEWLAATQEPALEPERPIIDPHHHLWDRPGNRYLFHDLLDIDRVGANVELCHPLPSLLALTLCLFSSCCQIRALL